MLRDHEVMVEVPVDSAPVGCEDLAPVEVKDLAVAIVSVAAIEHFASTAAAAPTISVDPSRPAAIVPESPSASATRTVDLETNYYNLTAGCPANAFDTKEARQVVKIVVVAAAAAVAVVVAVAAAAVVAVVVYTFASGTIAGAPWIDR